MDDTAFYFWWDGGFESVHNRKIKLSTQMKPRMLPQRNIDLIFQDENGVSVDWKCFQLRRGSWDSVC